jgi:hypothetical protein
MVLNQHFVKKIPKVRYLVMWYLRHFASEAKDVSSQEQLLFEQQLAVFRVTVIRLPELQLLLGCFPLRVNSHRNPVHTFHSEESIIN